MFQTASSQCPVYGGVPTFFRALCLTARRGGIGGYSNAGFAMGAALESDVPDNVEEEEWLDVYVPQFWNFAGQQDERAMLSWLLLHYPRWIAQVPARRRQSFFAGIYQYAAENL